jgi:hypothetical protein
MQALTRPTIGFKTPERALPQGGRVAIAVHKHHRWPGGLAGEQRARAGTKQQGGKGKKPEMSAWQSHEPDPLILEKISKDFLLAV